MVAVRILLVLPTAILALELLQVVGSAVHAVIVGDVLVVVPKVLVHALGVLRLVGERRRGTVRITLTRLPLFVYYPVLR